MRIFIISLCLLSFCLFAQNAEKLPKALKGYELYSWHVENEIWFCLITGTNRLKTVEEVKAPGEIIRNGWVKITVKGVESIKKALSRLPIHSNVFWSHDMKEYRYPSSSIEESLKKFCKELKIKLHLPSCNRDIAKPPYFFVKALSENKKRSSFKSKLSKSALKTLFNYILKKRKEKVVLANGIPADCWDSEIKKLNPIRVYQHRVNIVVVQKILKGKECGKYIYLPLSSYLPISGDDGFEFTPNPLKNNVYTIKSGVLNFTRKTSFSQKSLSK